MTTQQIEASSTAKIHSDHQKPTGMWTKLANSELMLFTVLGCGLIITNTVTTGGIGALARSKVAATAPRLHSLLTKNLLDTVKKSALCAIASTFAARTIYKAENQEEGKISKMIQVINQKTKLGTKTCHFIYLYALSVITTTGLMALFTIGHHYFLSSTLECISLNQLTQIFTANLALSILPNSILALNGEETKAPIDEKNPQLLSSKED